MPTTNGGLFTEHWQMQRMFPDGRVEIDLLYTNTANGQRRAFVTLFVPADTSLPIRDGDNNVIVAGGAWSTWSAAIQSYITTTNSQESTAAGASKLDR